MFCSNDINSILFILMTLRVYITENELWKQLSASDKSTKALIIQDVLNKNGIETSFGTKENNAISGNVLALIVDQQGTRIVRKNKTKYYLIDSSNGKETLIHCFDSFLKEDYSIIITRRKRHRGHSKNLAALVIEYITPYKNEFLQLVFSFLIVLVLQLVSPFLMQMLIDKGALMGNINVVRSTIIGVVIVKLGMFVAEFIKSWLFLNTGTKISLNLVSDFLEKVFKSPIDFFNTETTGNVLQRIDDNSRVESFLTKQLPQFIFSVLSLCVFMFVLAYYNARLFVIFTIGAICYLLWILFFWKIRKALDLRLFKYRAYNQDVLVQTLNSAQELRLNSSLNEYTNKWQDNQVNMFEQNEKMLYANKAQELGCLIINEAKDLLIIYFSVLLVMNGSITYGAMFAIQYILGQANSPLHSLPSYIMGLQMALISVERIDSFALEPSDSKHSGLVRSAPIHATVAFKGVGFAYAKVSPFYLKNITFTIEPGTITAIVGNTGCGKSTIAKLLLKCYNPTKGSIQIGGVNLHDINPDSWYHVCGSVLQDSILLNDTVFNNIILGSSDVDGARVIEALRKAYIYDFVESLPEGVNTKINFRGKGLSKGQIQRFLLARLFYKNPSYIVIDEATSSLDSETEAKIMDSLKSFLRDKTTLMITHNLKYAKYSSQILVMDRGRIVEWGTHDYLMERQNYYYRLFLLGQSRG